MSILDFICYCGPSNIELSLSLIVTLSILDLYQSKKIFQDDVTQLWLLQSIVATLTKTVGN